MSTRTSKFRVEFIANGDGTVRSAIRGVYDEAESGAKRGTTSAEMLARAYKGLMSVLASRALWEVGQAYVRMADASANMSARLRLATRSQEEFNVAHRESFAIAQRTSTELESVVDLYGKLAQATGDLGISQDALLSITEGITQAFQISGASAQEASNGLRQLTQAIAGGVLRAEEFNSIVEASPRLARALADGLGVSIGELRRMVNEGEVTVTRLLEAMQSQLGVLGKEFDTLPSTVGRAITEVRNALTRLVGDTDAAEGATRDLADAIADLARWLGSDETARGFSTVVSGLVQITEVGAGALGVITSIGHEVRESARYWEGFLRWASGTAGNNSGLFGVGDYLRNKAPWLYGLPSNRPPPAQAPEYHPGIDVTLPAPTADDPTGRNNTISADLQKEIDKVREQAQAYGLSRAALANLNRERALSAAANDVERAAINESYDALVRAIRADDAATVAKQNRAQAAEELRRQAEREVQDMLALQEYTDEAQRQYSLAAIQQRQDQEAAVESLLGSLEFEASLIGLSNVERAKEIALRRAGAAATEEQRQRIGELVKRIQEGTGEMTEHARQAARNMQDAFAEFLFDPFKDGVNGMLDSFAKTLQRMGAQAAASSLFSALGRWGESNSGGGGWQGALGQWLGTMFGGGRAAGGGVQRHGLYEVAEQGKAELLRVNGRTLLIPGEDGSVVPAQYASASAGPAGSRGDVIVNIHNAPEGTRVERSVGPNGGLQLDVLIDGIEKSLAARTATGGPLAAAVKGRFNLREGGA